MIEIRGPIRYEIDASEQEDGTWVLHYTEYFTENDWNEAREDSTKILEKMKGFMEVEMDDEKRMASLKIEGAKDQVMNMLAGEFLSFSTLGGMSLRDLFGLMVTKLAISGAFEE